jgi:pimeloyl-ACP methyl ester carboxylesterase
MVGAMDSEHFTVSKDGVHIAYQVSGEGKPVLLIHGFASSRDQNWHTTGWIDRLVRDGYRVVSFDLRGHGHSDKPHTQGAYGPHMIDDILAVMHAGGQPDANIMGYSMGAMLAIRLMMLYPERVRRVVAAGVGDNYFAEQQSWRDKVAAAMMAEDASSIADEEARHFRLFGGQKGKDRKALAACMRSSRHIYTPAELKHAKRPVLVVTGELDALTGPPYALAGAFADGRAVVLPNKDHMSAVGDPGYKRAVLDFFAAGERSATTHGRRE